MTFGLPHERPVGILQFVEHTHAPTYVATLLLARTLKTDEYLTHREAKRRQVAFGLVNIDTKGRYPTSNNIVPLLLFLVRNLRLVYAGGVRL